MSKLISMLVVAIMLVSSWSVIYAEEIEAAGNAETVVSAPAETKAEPAEVPAAEPAAPAAPAGR